MKRILPPLLTLATLAFVSVPTFAADTAAYREIKWEKLVPPGWDGEKVLKGLDLNKLQDSDPRAMEALDKMREAWNNAPVETALKGTKIRIPGFAIPLDKSGGNVREFLLVPYFGACIHSPPPPANQIIHVIATKPVKGLKTMDTVWVMGDMDLIRTDSPWGVVGYRLNKAFTEPYVEKGGRNGR
ncbi:MAG: DUF3299 domain-containing protein [Rhodocyclaceae bacterium]|nr:DUF3299 domain-containing protein [Rhodocyclaceae bacterium]